MPKPQLAPLFRLPLFAVGERSAEAAREAGFSDVRTPGGDAAALVRLIAERYAGRPEAHLYLAGEDRAADIEGDLARRGIPCTTVIVYRTVTMGFPPEVFAAMEGHAIDAVLHFSQRSADNYLAGARDAGLLAAALLPRHLCISGPVAELLLAAGAADVEIAARPDETALLALVEPGSA